MIALLLWFAAEQAHPACTLTAADKGANAKLSFDDFDQKGVLPSTMRALGNRGCWAAAAASIEDYLIHGPVPKPGQQRVLLFHLGQALALSGDEAGAAPFIAAARNPDQPPAGPDALRWNEYVTGTWAFLTKDRAALANARATVLSGAAAGDKINGALLKAMERCFDKPYKVAYDPKCGAS